MRELLSHSSHNYAVLKVKEMILVVGFVKSFNFNQTFALREICRSIARILNYYVCIETRKRQISQQYNLAFYITNLLSVFSNNCLDFLLERARVFIESEFGCPCASSQKKLISEELGKRHFRIDLLKNDFVDAIVTDSEEKMNCHIFSFGLSYMMREMQERIKKDIEIISIAQSMFQGKKLGFVLNSDDSIIHIHKDIKIDASSCIRLKDLAETKLTENSLRLNKVICKREHLDSFLNQKYGEEDFLDTQSEIRLIKGNNFAVVYIDAFFHTIDISNPPIKLRTNRRSKFIKELLLKTKDRLINKDTMKAQALIKKFGGFGDDKYFHAFAPGFSSISQDNAEILKDSLLSVYLDTKATFSKEKVQHQIDIAQKINNNNNVRMEKARLEQEFISFDLSDLDISEFKILEWDVELIGRDHTYLTKFVTSIFKSKGYFELYGISQEVFLNFISQMRFYYTFHENSFHNFTHGNMVCHAMFYMIEKTRLGKMISSVSSFAAILASFSHDVGHRAKNNGFEISSYSELSVRYNDVSVLENYHCSLTFEIMKEENCNILSNLTGEDFRSVRACIIECILATDMAKHKKLVGKMQETLDSIKESKVELKSEEQYSLLAYFTHTCDLSGSAKSFEITYNWSNLLRKEFMEQVNEEQKYGLPVTTFFVGLDKEATFLKGELYFQTCIIFELYSIADQVLDGDIGGIVKQINSNAQRFEEKYKEEQHK